jgi:S1-C subfamily serine protease
MRPPVVAYDDAGGGSNLMAESILDRISNELADAVAAAAPSVVQVLGRRRPASGVVHAPDVVVTTGRALGREDGLRVRRGGGEPIEAQLAGWDPATGLAVLNAPGLGAPAIRVSDRPARVGQFAIALARSWSNNATASAGIVSIIGGPLATGRRRSIDEVIRTTAPMHDGFAGGAFLGPDGGLLGIATAAAIRGLGVVIPSKIAWSSAAAILQHGKVRRGYLGVAGQSVALAGPQLAVDNRDAALLVVAVTAGSPAADAGLLVGDVVLDFDGQPVAAPEDLLDLLAGDRVGRPVPVRILRGTSAVTLDVTVGERPHA